MPSFILKYLLPVKTKIKKIKYWGTLCDDWKYLNRTFCTGLDVPSFYPFWDFVWTRFLCLRSGNGQTGVFNEQ